MPIGPVGSVGGGSSWLKAQGGGGTIGGKLPSLPRPPGSVGGVGAAGPGVAGGVTNLGSYGAPPPPAAVAAPQIANPTASLAPPPNLANITGTNPHLAGQQSSIEARTAQLRAREGQADPNLQLQVNRLGERLSSDPREQAQRFAAQDIDQRARAAQTALTQTLARRGIGGTGAEAQLRSQVEGQAQREKARSASQIGLQREQALDALTLGGQGIMAAPGQYQLQQQAQTNQLYPLGLQAAQGQVGAQQGAQNLALNQWQAQNQAAQGAQNLALNQWQAQQQAQQQAQAAQDQRQNQYLAQLQAFSQMGGY
jgi:hypothetical protein